MGNHIYYCEVLEDYSPEFPKGVLSITWKIEYNTKILRCMSYSHVVWVQGPRGGVRIIKDKIESLGLYGYVTKNEDAMKRFMWAKLKAQPLANYT